MRGIPLITNSKISSYPLKKSPRHYSIIRSFLLRRTRSRTKQAPSYSKEMLQRKFYFFYSILNLNLCHIYGFFILRYYFIYFCTNVNYFYLYQNKINTFLNKRKSLRDFPETLVLVKMMLKHDTALRDLRYYWAYSCHSLRKKLAPQKLQVEFSRLRGD